MRKPSARNVSLVKKLTETRKTALTSELAIARAALSSKEMEIAKLRRPVASGESISEHAAEMRWQRWRNKELVRLNSEYAVMRARFNQLALLAGRAIAEDATADHLQDMLDADARKKRSRQAETSHFLTHDIGNENI